MKPVKLLCLFIFLSCYAFGQPDLLEAARKKITSKDFTGAKADLTKFVESNPKNKLPLICGGGRE